MTKRNASLEGFAAEKNFIKVLSNYIKVKQDYYTPKGVRLPFLSYEINDLSTSLKFYAGGSQLSENDCNISFKTSGFCGALAKPFFGIDQYENVPIQSKFYSGNVKTNNIKHDVNNILLTPIVNNIILKKSFIAHNDIDRESWRIFNEKKVKPVALEDFLDKYKILIEVGKNSLTYDQYSGNEFIKHNYYLGELLLVQSGKKADFINFIDLENVKKNELGEKISSIDEKIEYIKSSFNAQLTHLNPEYYVYSTRDGKIDRKGLDYLKDINGKDCVYSDFESIIGKGEFFKNFKRINSKAYAINEIVKGMAKWELLEVVKQGLRAKELKIPHKIIQRAIDSFFN